MKYSRGRIIALTILSVTMVLALFGATLFYHFRDTISNVAAEVSQPDPDVAPGFDKLYQRIPFSASDTGSVELGQNTKLTLLEERYTYGHLTEFLNKSERGSFREFQRNELLEGDGIKGRYQYPVFTNTEMRSIARGSGDNLEIPVVMLDPHNNDDIVLFELTDLVDAPSNLMIKRGNDDGSEEVYTDSNNLKLRLVDSYAGDQVYAGIPYDHLTAKTDVVKDAEDNIILRVKFRLDINNANGYVVVIETPGSGSFYDSNHVAIQTIGTGVTRLYDSVGNNLYQVRRESSNGNETIRVFTSDGNSQIGENIVYSKDVNKYTTFDIGAVGYNSNALRGMFHEQGLYEISFTQRIALGDGVYTTTDISFAFIIVYKKHYEDNFPRFDTNNRARGYAEIYNYSYESDYPTVNYPKLYFDVKIETTVGEYYKNFENKYDQNVSNFILKFYNIGTYQMISSMQYGSAYLGRADRTDLKKRGVVVGNNIGYIPLKRYTTYSSVLNIFGFQAYYGYGERSDNTWGPLPFYDSVNSSISSDISTWVRGIGKTVDKSGWVVDYNHMRDAEAIEYSTRLAQYIDDYRLTAPVRTNYPPVKLNGNVKHAIGTGTNGEAEVILSTVAYLPANYVGNTNQWTSKTLEVGAPFEDAGKYVVVVYFKVNGKLCQQTFYFEIVNSAEIDFEIDTGSEIKHCYAGELELNHNLVMGRQVKLSYNGETTFGQFEVIPVVTLDYTEFGKLTSSPQTIVRGNDNSFAMNLSTPGQYQLTVQYGAHAKSSSVFNIIIDNTPATGIKVDTYAKSLSNLPENVAVVGAGEATLSWNRKLSGIKFKKVVLDFYAMRKNIDPDSNEVIDPNADLNYTNFPISVDNPQLNTLYSAYTFIASVSHHEYYEFNATETGWTLKQKFDAAGLYRFTIVDEYNNEARYVLIVDNSKPTFIQEGEKPDRASNAIDFDEDVGVKIGFGKNKLTRSQDPNIFAGTHQSIFNQLTGSTGVLVNNYISIPLAKIEISNAGGAYTTVSQADARNGYLVLNEEGTFYFRVTDVLGNIGEYYIILTHDKCFGMVYAESAPLKPDANGRITSEPNSSTSLVTSTGGMTNRSYVTFSFEQKAEDFHVDFVYLNYYPLTYDTNSKNYPFAERPSNTFTDAGQVFYQDFDGQYKGSIYRDTDENETDGTIRLSLYFYNQHTHEYTATPSGMYIITRIYKSDISNISKDTYARDYYFIVDRQKMLYYDANQYQTALTVHFAENRNQQAPEAKDANATVIYNNDNELKSNRTAWVNGFQSKYSWKHNQGTIYNIKDNPINYNILAFVLNNSTEASHNFNFPALTPRFSCLHNGQTTILGEGQQTWSIGDPANRTDSTIYRLLITDNARNISCMLTEGGITELDKDEGAQTSANFDYLTLDIDGNYGVKAKVILGENNYIETDSTRMVYDGNGYIVAVDPDVRYLQDLQFSFKSKTDDPNNMCLDVDVNATMASWVWHAADGTERSISFQRPEPVNGEYIIDLMQGALGDENKINGSSLSVNLITFDHVSTKYTILFDRQKPNYNLRRIKEQDNLARTLHEVPGDYIYGLSNDFVFESDQTNNPYLDTKRITYREVDYLGDDSQHVDATEFKLYTGKPGETRIPFATLVGLRANEMKYYRITEVDYTEQAEHVTSYIVQVQGSDYVNAISFIGAISDAGADIQIGVEMRALDSSVEQFILHNKSFKIVSGDDYYSVLNGKAEWKIGNQITSSEDNENESLSHSLINVLNNWINLATEKGEMCSYTLYDRMGDAEVYEFYNIRSNAIKMQLDCYQPNPSSSIIKLEVKNYDKLPRILLAQNLSPLFKIEVEDRDEGVNLQNVYFSINGTSIYADVTHELIIRVTDPFGRVSVTEYHQQLESSINFTTYGNTKIQDDGVIYLGDERGVDFSYLSTVYNIYIYKVDTANANTETLVNDIQAKPIGDMVYYTIRPNLDINEIQKYHIVAKGIASGAIMFEQTFAFDARLPEIDWKNDSDRSVGVEGQAFIGAVSLYVNIDPTMFPVTVSYTRTLNNHTETVTLSPLRSGVNEKITFYREGSYVVTLRNTVWAKQTFRFDIVSLGDTLVMVYDDGKQVQASTSDYSFTFQDENGQDVTTNITRYVFNMTDETDEDGIAYKINEYQKHGLTFKVGQANRVFAGKDGNDYYYCDQDHDTIVWRLATLLEEVNGIPVYTNPVFFATTGVTVNSLDTVNARSDHVKISLELNGNPALYNGGNTSSYQVTPLNTKSYNIVYREYMTDARNRKLTVKLYYDDSMFDSSDNPCFQTEGNLILVDCYCNGILVKTLQHDEVFTINEYEAGYYEFAVRDLAGNYLSFGNNTNVNSLYYKRNRYMLAVMTKPIVAINGGQPVNGMIYNDEVKLELINYGDTFLNKYYQSLVADGMTEDKTFFNKYFCITEMEIERTDSSGMHTETKTINGSATSFYWQQSGRYRITMRYRVHSNDNRQISSLLDPVEYTFQIVPSKTVKEVFSMTIYPEIPIISMKRDGSVVHDFSAYISHDQNGEYINFDANERPGSYVITLQSYNEILRQYVNHEVRFNIQHTVNSASSYFVSTCASVATVTGAVTWYYNPYWLYLAQGQVTITLYKHTGQSLETQIEKTVDSSVLSTGNYNSQELFTVSDAGDYSIIVRNAEGNAVFGDSWTIKAEQSTFGYTILAVVLGIFGVGILVFFRMRRKMTTK